MAKNDFDTLVLGATLVSAQGRTRADLAISNGHIEMLGQDFSLKSASQIIDASGKLVLPGIIDAHNHPVYDDGMEETSIAAVYGGVTTLIPFIGPNPAWGYSATSLTDTLRAFIDQAPAHSIIDFAVHGVFIGHDNLIPQIPSIMKLGVNSIKFFMMYKKRGMMVEDDMIIKIMDVLAENGGIAMVHAENGSAIDYLVNKHIEQGKVGNEAFIQVHRDLLEAEAVFRAIALAEAVSCPLYIPHLAVKEGVEIIKLIKNSLRMPLFVETCPHYLTLTNEKVLKDGPPAKIAPPIREKHDNDALWQGLQDRIIDTIGTDHIGITLEKKLDSHHILDAKFGGPSIEYFLPLIYSKGVREGKLSLTRMVEVLCENPAKIFGLYPRKGVLAPGADADLVVFDPEKRKTCSVQNQHSKAGYCLYEGIETFGAPVTVMQRGKILLENGNLKGKPGDGKYLRAETPVWNRD